MEKREIIYFSKTIAAYDIKVGRCIELNDLLKLHKYQMTRPLLTFAKGHSVFKLKYCFSQILLGYLNPNIISKPFGAVGEKYIQLGLVI